MADLRFAHQIIRAGKARIFLNSTKRTRSRGKDTETWRRAKGCLVFYWVSENTFFFQNLMSWGFWNSFGNSRFSWEFRELGLENSLPTWLLHAIAGTSSCCSTSFPPWDTPSGSLRIVTHFTWEPAPTGRRQTLPSRLRATPSADTGSLCHSHWSEQSWVKNQEDGEIGHAPWGGKWGGHTEEVCVRWEMLLCYLWKIKYAAKVLSVLYLDKWEPRTSLLL